MNHNKCKFSTDISGEVTAGQGNIDEYGFFEKPCIVCLYKLQNLFCNETMN